MLDLWLYGTHLATITVERADRMRFAYSTDAIDRWGFGSRIFTVAHPISDLELTPGPTAAIVENILPEGDALDTLRRSFGSSANLLMALGRETIGAVVIVETGAPPPDPDPEERLGPLSNAEVAARIRSLDTAPLGVSREGTVRLSLTGQQPKLPLVQIGDSFADPTYTHPSDVILKPEQGSWPQLARLEHWGLAMTHAADIPTPPNRLIEIDGIQILAIERYDRNSAADIDHRRLHQEDLCMATGAKPHEKYATSRRSKTSLRNMALTIHDNTDDPHEDIGHFITTLLLNIAIGNCDAHARNTSLLHDVDGTIRLAPAYDVIPTFHYAGHEQILAQPINGQQMKPETVTGAHLALEFDTWDLPNLGGAYASAYERVEHALRTVSRPDVSRGLERLLGSVDRLTPR